MRKQIGKSVKVTAGDTVVIFATLQKRQTQARLGLWSRVGDYPYAPYVPSYKISTIQDGKPVFARPAFFTLIAGHEPEIKIVFVAEETTEICVQQEVDTPADDTASVKVTKYGNPFSKIRWRMRNAFRLIRSRATVRDV